MKKYLLSLLAVTILPITTWAQDDSEEPVDEPVSVAINETNFPDDAFRAVVVTFDADGDEVLSEEEIAAASYGSYDSQGNLRPNVLDLKGLGIADLTGIEYFTSTRTLYLQKNKLTSLDVTALTELKDLRIASTSGDKGSTFATLDVSKNTKLSTLECAYLGLTSLDISNNPNLTQFFCNNNKLTSINIENQTNLQYFNCSDNNIGTLNVENNKKLLSLKCDHCGLSELNVTENKSLQTLYCEGAISKNDIDNYLTELNVSNNTNLTSLRFGYNDITDIDVSKLTNLKEFICRSNQLTELDVSNNTALTNLKCGVNHLTTLDLSTNKNLTTIDVDGQEVETDAFVIDRDKIAIEVTPSFNENDFTTEMFKNLSNGKDNTFTFTDGEQEYVYDEWSDEHFLVIAKPKTDKTGKDIDLRNQVVKYEFDVQNASNPNETMSVTVNIPYPYIMFVNPETETTIEEVGDANAGEIAKEETFYSGTIYLDYDSWVGNYYLEDDYWQGYEAYLYAAKYIIEDNLEDMLHVGQNPTPKQIYLEKNDWYTEEILPSETPAYVKAPLPGYYAFNRIVEPEMVPQVKQERKAPRKSPFYTWIFEDDIERAAENFEDNLFQGTLEDLPVDFQSVLTLGREKGIPTGVVGFWRYIGETVAAHRAYLPANLLTNPEGGDVKGFTLRFANDATGIRQIESNEESGAWYNLQGVQMAAPTQKGIYIRNGKKLIVR